MAFYKVRLQKKSGLYYPQAVVVGKQVSTKQLGKALSDRSTVTLADTLAVLSELGTVMSTFMAQGRSVSLEGLGSFRYTINSQKQGVETAEEVNSDQIKSLRAMLTSRWLRVQCNLLLLSGLNGLERLMMLLPAATVVLPVLVEVMMMVAVRCDV